MVYNVTRYILYVNYTYNTAVSKTLGPSLVPDADWVQPAICVMLYVDVIVYFAIVIILGVTGT